MSFIIRENKNVKLEVMGGVGNQLFQYSAGKCLASALGVPLLVDPHLLKSISPSREFELQKIVPTLELVRESYNCEGLSRFMRASTSRLNSNSYLYREIAKILGWSYYSPVIGYDPELIQITKPRRISGYFQSYKYYQALQRDGIHFQVNTIESDWHSQKIRELEAGQVFAIHVRRGDYRALKSSFGLLNFVYYQKAMTEIASKVEHPRFWIFSDEPESAQMMFNSDMEFDIKFIKPPIGSASIIALDLMSRSTGIIIANSSFSWWGAMLGEEKKIVIAPKKWFRSLDDPHELYPESWTLLDSSWDEEL